ncbi:Protein of unknown function [Pyronema omphalodes CBS 100304]|uniref:Uncharacterized protein n=1 Tax=Pyronema omphalodes (strain CBS 100304) TaxID=1076935 RepID=U4LSH9_PYROM|nr:Protein of unknown function [Pyronema omphalodes CBS 100304]
MLDRVRSNSNSIFFTSRSISRQSTGSKNNRNRKRRVLS